MLMSFASQQPATHSIPGLPARNPESTKRIASEQASAEINRLVATLDFSSLEDANAYLQAALVYKNGFLIKNAGQREQSLKDINESSAGMRRLWNEELADSFPDIPEAWEKAMQATSAKDEAQRIMYEAWCANQWRVEIARHALSIDPDCIDALVLLAQESAETLEEAKIMFCKAMTIAECEFANLQAAPDYWKDITTRPYMRAKAGFAAVLWQLGEHTKSISHMEDLIQYNPEDNQGIRYELINSYLELNMLDSARLLLDKYYEPGTRWMFSRALYQFMTERNAHTTATTLRVAIENNLFVDSYLLQDEELPVLMPAYFEIGSMEEACEYAAWSKGAWQKVNGALEWLKKTRDEVKARIKHPSHKLWMAKIEEASRYVAVEQYAKAKGSLLFALKLAEKLGEDAFLVLTLIKLCATLTEMEPALDQEPVYIRMKTLTEKYWGKGSIQYAAALLHYGGFKIMVKQWDEAEAMLIESGTMAEKLKLKDLLSEVLFARAAVAKRQGKLALASNIREQAEKLRYSKSAEEYSQESVISR